MAGNNAEKYTKAMDYYQKGKQLGYNRSYQAIGYLYQQGFGVPKSYEKAREYYEKGVAAGDENAMVYLANLYQYGFGVAPDINKAKELLNRACNIEGSNGYSCRLYRNIK